MAIESDPFSSLWAAARALATSPVGPGPHPPLRPTHLPTRHRALRGPFAFSVGLLETGATSRPSRQAVDLRGSHFLTRTPRGHCRPHHLPRARWWKCCLGPQQGLQPWLHESASAPPVLSCLLCSLLTLKCHFDNATLKKEPVNPRDII